MHVKRIPSARSGHVGPRGSRLVDVRSEDSQIGQNALGDIVIPADEGEVVLLPRLWDLNLLDVDEHDGTLSLLGLVVTVRFADSAAAVVRIARGSELIVDQGAAGA